MKEVKFIKATYNNYKKRIPIDNDNSNIYFITDKNEIRLGDEKISSAFIYADDITPLPQTGSEGVFYVDKSNNSFTIKIWDSINEIYVTLPLATSDYIKSISREADSIVGIAGTGRRDEARLDEALTTADIDSLFPEDEEEI